MRYDISKLRNSRWWRLIAPFKNRLRASFEYDRLKKIYGKEVALINTHAFKKYAKKYVCAAIEASAEDTCKDESVKISVLVPLFNTPEKYLKEMIGTVLAQTYRNFELILSDVSDDEHDGVKKICLEFASQDKRIKYVKHEKRLRIAENTNEALKLAEGEYVALLDHDDKLMLNALSECARAINETHGDVFYSDEYMFEKDDPLRVSAFFFKSDFCIYDLRALNYICHFLVIKRKLFLELNGERAGFDGAQDHDLVLRLYHKGAKIVHIPKLLYRWRAHKGSTALGTGEKNYASESGKRAVTDELKKANINAFVTVTETFPTVYRVEYGAKIGTSVGRIVIDEKTDAQKLMDDVTSENSDILIISKKDVSIDAESEQELKAFACRSDVGAVGGILLDENGDIISNGIEYRDQINPFVTVNDAGEIKYQRTFNRRLYYARSVDEVESLIFIRKSVFLECVTAQLEGDLISEICKKIKKNGYFVISDPYARVIKSGY